MITCKECGNKISRMAEQCPYCGHKTRFGKEVADCRQSRTAVYGTPAIFAVCIILLMICFTGCNAEKKGVIDKGDYCYYVIALSSKEIGNYFTPVGEAGKTAYTDVKTTSTVVVYHVPIAEGGWIAYTSNQVAYIPSEAGESGVNSACTYIAMNSDNYMTIQEAEDYISWLNP